jgi:hypothetical protein
MFGLDAGLTACLVVALQTFVLERLDHLQSIACCASRNNYGIYGNCRETKRLRTGTLHSFGSGGRMAFAPSGLSWSRPLLTDATRRAASAEPAPSQARFLPNETKSRTPSGPGLFVW